MEVGLNESLANPGSNPPEGPMDSTAASYSDEMFDNNSLVDTVGRLMSRQHEVAAAGPGGLDNQTQATIGTPDAGQPHHVDLSSIVNVTREYPFDYAIVMFGYLLPFVLAVSLVTNCLVVAVLYQRHMRTPTNIVLFTMAIVDLCTLLSPSPWYLYIYTFGNHNKFLHPPSMCYVHHLMTDVIPVFFHTASIWLALLLASQRYIYVCHPTLARTWCTVPRVKCAIIWILSTAGAHQLSRVFDNDFESVSIEYNNVQHLACRNSIAKWVEWIDVPLYYGTYYTFRIFFVFIIPCFALLTLNLLLFRALKRAENKRCQLLKTKFRATDAEPSERQPNQNHSVTGAYLTEARSSYNMVSGLGMAGGGGGGGGAGGLERLGAPVSSLVGLTRSEGQATLGDSGATSGQSSPTSEDTTGQVSPLDPGELKFQALGTSTNARRSSKRTTGEEEELNKLQAQGERGQQSAGQTSAEIKRYPLAERRTSASEARSSAGSTASRSGASTSGSRTSRSSRTSSKGEEDHESTCAECAAAFRKEAETLQQSGVYGAGGGGARACRRCSDGASSPDGASGCLERTLPHQPVSQCSSVLGGAGGGGAGTNTIITEDISSSCQVTQNASSSMLMRAGGTLDNIEDAASASAGFLREEADEQDEQTDNAANEAELSINCDEGGEEDDDDDDDEREPGLTKRDCGLVSSSHAHLMSGQTGEARVPIENAPTTSVSVESRRACGCFTAQASALRRVRLLSAGKRLEVEPVDANSAATRETPDTCRQQVSGPASGAHGHTCDKSGRSSLRIKNSTSLLLGFEESEHLGQEVERGKRSRQQRAASQCPTTLAASRLSTAQPSATCTTTTTLYSAHTNSVGSLALVQPTSGHHQAAVSGASRQQAAYQQRMKSPSYASCATGRGSRATLLGSTAIPLIVPSQQQQNNIQATISSSSRTMDSNRTTLMLVVVVTVFLVVEVPVALVTIVHVVCHLFERFQDVQVQAWLDYVKLFTNFCIMISYSVNFTIYCSMSKKFRETFRDLFFCSQSAKRKRTRRLLYQQSQAQQSMYEPYTQVHQFAAPASGALANHNQPAGGRGSAVATTNNLLPVSNYTTRAHTAASNGRSPDGHHPSSSCHYAPVRSQCEV